jgi:hypothetical protein
MKYKDSRGVEHWDIDCPYCNAGNDVCHDDGEGYEEGIHHEMQCRKCDKYFTFQTEVSHHYKPSKADCLNGAPHELETRKRGTSDGIKYYSQCKNCEHETKTRDTP